MLICTQRAAAAAATPTQLYRYAYTDMAWTWPKYTNSWPTFLRLRKAKQSRGTGLEIVLLILAPNCGHQPAYVLWLPFSFPPEMRIWHSGLIKAIYLRSKFPWSPPDLSSSLGQVQRPYYATHNESYSRLICSFLNAAESWLKERPSQTEQNVQSMGVCVCLVLSPQDACGLGQTIVMAMCEAWRRIVIGSRSRSS